jgi:hypothetical protein
VEGYYRSIPEDSTGRHNWLPVIHCNLQQ